MLPVTVTNIHHAFREIKHFGWSQWQGEGGLPLVDRLLPLSCSISLFSRLEVWPT